MRDNIGIGISTERDSYMTIIKVSWLWSSHIYYSVFKNWASIFIQRFADIFMVFDCFLYWVFWLLINMCIVSLCSLDHIYILMLFPLPILYSYLILYIYIYLV